MKHRLARSIAVGVLLCGVWVVALASPAYSNNCKELQDKAGPSWINDKAILADCLRTGSATSVVTAAVTTAVAITVGWFGVRPRPTNVRTRGPNVRWRPKGPYNAPRVTEDLIHDTPAPPMELPPDPPAPPPIVGPSTTPPPPAPPPPAGPGVPPAAPPDMGDVISGTRAKEIIWASQHPGVPYDPSVPLRFPGPGSNLPPGMQGAGLVPKTLPDGSVVIDPDQDVAIIVNKPMPRPPEGPIAPQPGSYSTPSGATPQGPPPAPNFGGTPPPPPPSPQGPPPAPDFSKQPPSVLDSAKAGADAVSKAAKDAVDAAKGTSPPDPADLGKNLTDPDLSLDPTKVTGPTTPVGPPQQPPPPPGQPPAPPQPKPPPPQPKADPPAPPAGPPPTGPQVIEGLDPSGGLKVSLGIDNVTQHPTMQVTARTYNAAASAQGQLTKVNEQKAAWDAAKDAEARNAILMEIRRKGGLGREEATALLNRDPNELSTAIAHLNEQMKTLPGAPPPK